MWLQTNENNLFRTKFTLASEINAGDCEVLHSLSYPIPLFFFFFFACLLFVSLLSKLTSYDRSEIRTRATEVTGALNQRLRPLGHPALLRSTSQAGVVARVNLVNRIDFSTNLINVIGTKKTSSNLVKVSVHHIGLLWPFSIRERYVPCRRGCERRHQALQAT